MKQYVLFFSHAPQINWFALMARVLRQRFGITSELWVIGQEDERVGKATGEFHNIVNLIRDESDDPMLRDVSAASSILCAFEAECGELFINQDIAMDRYLARARWPIDRCLLYAASILLRIRRQLEKNGSPVFAVGEENALHYRLARRQVGAPYFCPYMVGHWGDRFCFEYTMYWQWQSCQDRYLQFQSVGIPEDLRKRAEQRLDELIKKRQQPADTVRFLAEGGNSLMRKFTVGSMSSVWKRTVARCGIPVETWDPRSISIIQENPLHSIARTLREFRCKYYFKSVAMRALPQDRDFAAFFLHMQPEHTVEGLAFEYRDQAATARTIAASLPAGMLLLVKEHPTMVGLRPTSFYDELCSCANIRLLDDTVNSYDVVRRAKLLVTLTGSVALESMYEGKPAIVLGHVYHSAFKGIHRVDNIRGLAKRIREVFEQPNAGGAQREDAIAALASMYATSVPGRISSQYTLEEMASDQNLEDITVAFENEFALQRL